MIVCENLSKVYGNRLVLSNVSQVFGDRGFYLLMGDSGSGKSTLLNILAGLIPFEAGAVCWDGQRYEQQVDAEAVAGGFDYITQDPFFVDFLSVTDNLRLISEDDSRIIALLDRFGLGEKAHSEPTTLSGGECQRLAIVRALLSGKRVLLLDEPTASLDEENKLAVFELLARLKEEMLIICSTHDIAAEPYADQILRLNKHGETTSALTEIKSRQNKRQVRDTPGKKRRLTYFLKQWFRSRRRSRKPVVLYTVFLTAAFCMCMFADTPSNKMDSTIEHIYKINMLTVKTMDHRTWADIAPEGADVPAVVLSYSASCPDGSEHLDPEISVRPLPDYEMQLQTLPFDAGAFRLSGNMACGTYFTGENQVILSWEKARVLSPEDPGALVGRHLSKKVFGLGEVDLEIVGIFSPFDDLEKKYMKAIGIHIPTGDDYNPDEYEGLFFINSSMTDRLENDSAFFSGGRQQRTYHLYFRSYQQMRAFYDAYYGTVTADGTTEMFYSRIDISLSFAFQALFYVFTPLAVFMSLFASLFYVTLRKTEYIYNCRFVAVFEYAGFSKNAVIRRFVLLNIRELLKNCGIALAAALVLTGCANYVNETLKLVHFRLFTYNVWFLLCFITLLLTFSSAAIMSLFGRVKVSSWYENLISSRDLI